MLGSMRVEVLFFGVLKEVAGSARETVELQAGATAGGLIAVLRERTSNRHEVWARLAVAVNRVYAGREAVLADGDEVALLPPVSGGRR